MCCPVIQEGWTKISSRCNQCGPLGTLGLADEADFMIVARMAYLYCVFTVLAQLQVRRLPVAKDTFMRLINERRRYIEGHCNASSCALRECRPKRSRREEEAIQAAAGVGQTRRISADQMERYGWTTATGDNTSTPIATPRPR